MSPIDIDTLTIEEENKVLAEYYRRFSKDAFFSTFEELMTSPDGFGLETATPVQRAICRIIEGLQLGDLAEDPDVLDALGGKLPEPGKPPPEVDILAAVRTAKSMMAAALAIWASQTVDVTMALSDASGQIPRYSIVSLELDNAKVVLQHLLGALNQPRLKHLRINLKEAGKWSKLISEIGGECVGSVFVWHPDGIPIEIRITAGKRAGGGLVSRWSAGCTLDEAPRMVGGSDAVINYDDERRAVRARLLPGAQLFSIGSPWKPFGPMYERHRSRWGLPVPHHVVIKARGPQMNPFWWTPERCAEIKLSDPMAYQTDVLAEFADDEESMFPQSVLNPITRPEDNAIPYHPGHDYSATMDPATRGNAWTLVVVDRIGRKKRVVFNKSWQGTTLEPLRPKAVLTEIRDILREYNMDWCYTDQWSADANQDLAADLRMSDGSPGPLFLIIEDWTEQNKVNAFLSMAVAAKEKTLELPNNTLLLQDLRLTYKVPTQRGVSIKLTKTPDGRHCDYAPALARAVFRWLQDEQELPPKRGETGYDKYLEEKQIAAEEAAVRKNEDQEWWETDPWDGTMESFNDYRFKW